MWMIFFESRRPEYRDTRAYEMQGPEAPDKLPEDLPGEIEFVRTTLGAIEKDNVLCGYDPV